MIVQEKDGKYAKGSGLGLPHSSDLADLAYFNGAERGWAACPVPMEASGMLNTWRFTNDVVVAASERRKSHTNGRRMINSAGYFITRGEHKTMAYLSI